MKKHNWQIMTAMRHWSASLNDGVIRCEFCDAHATYSSSLVDEEGITKESHWHCDPHGDDAIALLERTKYESLRIVVHPRHWMHIWKVGLVRCVTCGRDSRFVASYLDQSDKVVVQKMYCEHHRPQSDPSVTIGNDITSQMKFGLGFSTQVIPDEDADETDPD